MTTKTKILFLGGTLLGLLLGQQAEAATISACAKPNGMWRMATAKKPCKKKEVAVQLNSGTEASSAGSIKVYDHNNQLLGYLANPSDFTVYIPSLQAITLIDNSPSSSTYGQILPPIDEQTSLAVPRYFTDGACTAGPYFLPKYPYPVVVKTNGEYRIVKDKPGLPKITIKSAQVLDQTGKALTCKSLFAAQEVPAAPAPTYDLSEPVPLPFAPPVAFPLRFE
jgi:hypothetical protein